MNPADMIKILNTNYGALPIFQEKLKLQAVAVYQTSRFCQADQLFSLPNKVV